jgi:hypothetical protein
VDIIVSGQGEALENCRRLLTLAGFDIGYEVSADHNCPAVVGEIPHLYSQALQLVEAGKDLLLTHPQSLSAAQQASLLAARKPRQALFFWHERRFHPAYRLVSGLIRSDDGGWSPRALRHSTMSAERPSATNLRWLTCEVLALLAELAASQPKRASAHAIYSPWRGASDFLSATIEFEDSTAVLEVGLGEGKSTRETVVAAYDRKAYIDELDAAVPLRLSDDAAAAGAGMRTIACQPLGTEELARQQCVAFLEAQTNGAKCEAEADRWRSVLSCWQTIQESLEAGGAPMEVREPVASGLRVLSGRSLRAVPHVPVLRVVS